MGLANGRTFEQSPLPSGALSLAGMGPSVVHRAIEGRVCAGQGVKGQGADDIGGGEEPACVGQSQSADGGRSLSAIDQGEAFLRPEDQGIQTDSLQRLVPRDPLSTDKSLTFANEGQREMRQWSEISRCTHRTEARHHRVDTRI